MQKKLQLNQGKFYLHHYNYEISYDRLLWRLYHERGDKMVPKFRAWLKYDKEMKNVLAFDTRGHSFLGIEGPHVTVDGWCDNFEVGKQAVLMQSTGLKDKNGVEIFEGDLVNKFSNINKFTDDFAEDLEPTYAITSIVRDGACFKTTFKGLPSLVLDQNGGSMAKHMEVIGNVHENPELLEKANES